MTLHGMDPYSMQEMILLMGSRPGGGVTMDMIPLIGSRHGGG